MAITPRTILTSAAPATVAVVSLYFFTVLGTAAFSSLNDTDDSVDQVTFEESSSADMYRSSACDHVAARFGDEPSQWSEFAWVNFTYCFDQNDDSPMVIKTARQGLEHHPSSEVLYNLKGYHQIVTDDHAAAIDTLREGMDQVAHSRNGVMANNLAWAGLWEPRQMQLEEARGLYVKSLAQSPGVCETVHTGLFVEFALANQAQGLERFDALKRFSELRNRYNRCLDRLDDGKWETVVEIIGAAVLFDNVDNANPKTVHPLMRSATQTLIRDHGEVTIEEVCEEAMPLADFHHDCIETVENSVEAQRALEKRHHERNERAAQIQDEISDQYGDDYPTIESNDQTSGCRGVNRPTERRKIIHLR